MLTISATQLDALGDAAPGTAVIQPCRDAQTWIAFRLVDREGNPIPGERYTVRLPDHSLHSGRLDRDGCVRFEGILPGEAQIAFPGIDAREWWPLGSAPPPPPPPPSPED
jgi:type VI secretion system secreted protein VgrG